MTQRSRVLAAALLASVGVAVVVWWGRLSPSPADPGQPTVGTSVRTKGPIAPALATPEVAGRVEDAPSLVVPSINHAEPTTARPGLTEWVQTGNIGPSLAAQVRFLAESGPGPYSLGLNLATHPDRGVETIPLVSLEVHSRQPGGGGLAISGRVAGEPLSHATVGYAGDAVSGMIHQPERHRYLAFRSERDGSLTITSFDPAAIPGCGVCEKLAATRSHP